MMNRLKNWVSNLLVIQKVLAFIANIGAKHLAAFGLASAATVMGAGATVRTIQNQNDIQDQAVVYQQRIEQIQQTGDDSSDELRRILEEQRQAIIEQGRLAAEALNATAEQLTGDVQTTASNAALQLNQTSDELEQSDAVTIQSLNETADAINQTIQDTSLALQDSDININQILSGQIFALEQSQIAINDAQQLQIDNLPPVGSIAWVVDTTLVDANHYVNCDGADINGNILPNINADGLFVRGGVFDGLSNPDTTAVNGLAGTFFDDTSNGPNVNITYYSAIATGGTGANNGLTGATDSVSLMGDNETAPVNLLLTCFVRYQ